MKKLVVLAVMAVGMLVGANGAHASTYPPVAPPAITPPVTAAPGASVTIVVSNIPVGATVTLTFQGINQSKPVPPASGATAVAVGSVSFTLVAPNAAGTYPVSATSTSGANLSTSVTVTGASTTTTTVQINPPTTTTMPATTTTIAGGGGTTTTVAKTTTTAAQILPPPPPARPGGKLPATGTSIMLPAVSIGLAALAGGLGLLFVSKRRRSAAA